METWRGRNIYKSEDVIRPNRLNSVEEGLKTITVKALPEDAYSTISVDTGNHCITAGINLSQADIKPFKCPCCGGNSYKSLNGKIICEYCDTEFLTSPAVGNPLKDIRPKPLPTRITR